MRKRGSIALQVYLCSVVLFGTLMATAPGTAQSRSPGTGQSGKSALVYNGPAAEEDCPEAAAAVAKTAGLRVRYISRIRELPRMLKGTAVFIIGGTVDDLRPLLKEFTPDVTEALKEYLRTGGRYFGICGGGFMASSGWVEDGTFVKALGILPARAAEFQKDDAARILPVRWLGKTIPMYFQAGPNFHLTESRENVKILAYYTDGSIAALLSSYGRGKVAVCGPHPEATESWKDEAIDGNTWISSTHCAVELLKDVLSDRTVAR